ncbi:MAG TPA: hypothetical protein VIG69_14960, partial [Candidatus Methylomirabilis sp.]
MLPRDFSGSSLLTLGLVPVADAVAHGRPAAVTGLWGSAKANILARLLEDAPRPVLVVCPTAADAETFARGLRFFLGAAAPVALLPDADGDLEAQAARVKTLYGLRTGSCRVAV